MQPELMCPSGPWPKPKAIGVHLFIICHGLVAMFHVYDLSWPVVEVRANRQGYYAFLWRVVRQRVTQYRHVSFSYLVACELSLQVVIGLHGLGYYHQSARGHVESVHDERRWAVGESVPHDGEHALAFALAWHGEQSGGFANDADVVVVIDGLESCRQVIVSFAALQWVGVNVHALQHPFEDGLAFAVAGWVEMEMMPNLTFRALTPPEHGHRPGCQSMLKRVLQQPRLTTFAAAGWRYVSTSNLYQVFALALGVEHAEMAEEPPLQVVAFLSPEGLQARQSVFFFRDDSLGFPLPEFPPVQFSVFKLSSANVVAVAFTLTLSFHERGTLVYRAFLLSGGVYIDNVRRLGFYVLV